MRKAHYTLTDIEESGGVSSNIVCGKQKRGEYSMNPIHSELVQYNSEINTDTGTEETLPTGDDPRMAWKGGPSKYVTLLAFIAALNSCNLGFDQGVNAGVASSMQRGDPNTLYLSDYKLEVFMGIMSAAALVGACSMFYFAGMSLLLTRYLLFFIVIQQSISVFMYICSFNCR